MSFDSRRQRDIELKEREIPKLEDERKKLATELDKLRSSAYADDERMLKALEYLQKTHADLKAKADRFVELRNKNKYVLKNMALSLQRAGIKAGEFESAFKLDPKVEKTSFHSQLQKEPFLLTNNHSESAARLFFFDVQSMAVGLGCDNRNSDSCRCCSIVCLLTAHYLPSHRKRPWNK